MRTPLVIRGVTMSANHKKFENLIKNIEKIQPMNRTFKQITTFNKSIMTFKGISNIAPDYLCNKFNGETTQ